MARLLVAVFCVALAECSGGAGKDDGTGPAPAGTSALARAQAEADAGRAALAAGKAPTPAERPSTPSLLGPPDADGFGELDWSRMVPPEDFKALENAPPVLHVGNQRMKQVGTLHTVAALDGRKVRLPGYVVPLESDDQGRMVEFFFVPFYGACIHVPPPPPNMLVHVRLAQGVPTPSLYDPVTLKGVLHTETTQNAMAASAYAMSGATLEPYRDDDAARLRQAFE